MRPPAVPGFIVTPSRIRQSAPMVERRLFAAIFEILRLMADRGEGKNLRLRAPIFVRPATHDMGFQPHPVAKHDLRADHGRKDRFRPRRQASRRPRRWRKDESSYANIPWLANQCWPGSLVYVRKPMAAFEIAQSLGSSLMIMAVISASATSTPSTIAPPLYHQILRRWFSLRHVEFDAIAGNHRLAEFRLVDGHEIDQRRLGAAEPANGRTARPPSAPWPRSATRRETPACPGNGR